jgi:hypothetical protein
VGVNSDLRKGGRQVTGAPGMVKVDMGDGNTRQVVRANAVLCQSGNDNGDRALAPSFYKHRRPALY